MSRSLSYTSVVFAGGGNRCIWQAGFWDVVGPALEVQPKVVAGVSAGAHTACVLFAGRSLFGRKYLEKLSANNHSNFRFSNLMKGKSLFPHFEMYRRAILTIFDEEAFNRLKRGPEVRVLLARPPRWTGSFGGVALGFLSYTFEKYVTAPLHPRLPAPWVFGLKSLLWANAATPKSSPTSSSLRRARLPCCPPCAGTAGRFWTEGLWTTSPLWPYILGRSRPWFS